MREDRSARDRWRTTQAPYRPCAPGTKRLALALSPPRGSPGRRRLAVLTQDGERQLEGWHLLVAVGRIPNTDAITPEAAGIRLNHHGFIEVDEYLETAGSGSRWPWTVDRGSILRSPRRVPWLTVAVAGAIGDGTAGGFGQKSYRRDENPDRGAGPYHLRNPGAVSRRPSSAVNGVG